MSGWRNILRSRPVKFLVRAGTVLRWTLRLLLVLLVLDLFYLAITWPDWHQLASGSIPKSAFMLHYEQERARKGEPPSMRWQPVALATIPKHLQRAVIVAEDSRFYEHNGFDLIAFKEAMDHNVAEGRLAVGASTISQQTVKNLFLSSARTPWRKWHELILTWGMERNLSKARILELYLNIAELGPGIYGVQAAAQNYWHVNATQLDPRQSAELAATLPSPIRNNPFTRTPQFDKRSARILRLLVRHPGDAAEGVSGWERILKEPESSETTEIAPECTDDDCPVTTTDSAPPAPPGQVPMLEHVSPNLG